MTGLRVSPPAQGVPVLSASHGREMGGLSLSVKEEKAETSAGASVSEASSFSMRTRALGELLAWLGLRWVGPLGFLIFCMRDSCGVLAPHSDEILGKRSGVQGLTEAGLGEPCGRPGHSLKVVRGTGAPLLSQCGVETGGPGRLGRGGGGLTHCIFWLKETEVQAPHTPFLFGICNTVSA